MKFVQGVVLSVMLMSPSASFAMDERSVLSEKASKPPRRSSAITLNLVTSPLSVGDEIKDVRAALRAAFSFSAFNKEYLHAAFFLDSPTEIRTIDKDKLSPEVINYFISSSSESRHRYLIGDMLFRLAMRFNQDESVKLLLSAGYIALPQSSIPGDKTSGVIFLQWAIRQKGDLARDIVAVMRATDLPYSEDMAKEVESSIVSFGEGEGKKESYMVVIKPKSGKGRCTIL